MYVQRMPRDNRLGTCRLCRKGDTTLTFEHVPPRSAFNRTLSREYTYDAWQLALSRGRARYEQFQRGSGGYYLCDPCNRFLGQRYVREFRNWAYAAATLLMEDTSLRSASAKGEPTSPVDLVVRGSRPLLFVKQILSMFIALTPSSLETPDHNILRQFVLEPHASCFFNHIRVEIRLNGYPHPCVGLDSYQHGLEPGVICRVDEIAHPPFTYRLVYEPRGPEGSVAGDITHLAAFSPELHDEIALSLPVGLADTIVGHANGLV
jgi:hypothetical protein